MEVLLALTFGITRRGILSIPIAHASNSVQGHMHSFDLTSSELITDGPKIKFYTDITQESCLDLQKKIFEYTEEINSLGSKHVINIHIQSSGGSVVPALYTCGIISNNPVPIHTHVDGLAASAASLIGLFHK